MLFYYCIKCSLIFISPSILLILQHVLIKMLPYANNTQYLLTSYNVPETGLNTLWHLPLKLALWGWYYFYPVGDWASEGIRTLPGQPWGQQYMLKDLSRSIPRCILVPRTFLSGIGPEHTSCCLGDVVSELAPLEEGLSPCWPFPGNLVIW